MMRKAVNQEVHLCDALSKIAEGHPISRIHELTPWSADEVDHE